jgi:serine O-acetyltransferase
MMGQRFNKKKYLHNLPSKRAVGHICEDLLQWLFPGFHDDDAVHQASLLELTHQRMERVVTRLTEQVRRGVRVGNPKKPTGRTPPIMKKPER